MKPSENPQTSTLNSQLSTLNSHLSTLNSPLSTLNSPLVPPGYKHTEVGVIPFDWGTATLGSLTVLMTNGFVGTATTHYASNDNGILYIQGYNVEENSFNFHGIKFVTVDFHRAHMKSCLRGGDLLTVQTGEVGLTTIVPKSLAGSNCHALIISRFDQKRVSPTFISYYLNSKPGRSRLKLIEIGTTMKHLNVGDMLQFGVPLPPTKAEQEGIAEALSDADALIESLEQLLTKKRHLKQGAMQELLTGKTRLPGFEIKPGYKQTEVGVIPEDWDVTKLTAVCSMKSGEGITSETIDQFSKYPCFGGNGLRGFTTRFTHDGGYALIGRQGALCGNVLCVEGKLFASEHAIVVTAFAQTNIRWLTFVLKEMRLNQYSESSAQPGLSVSKLLSLTIPLPSTKAEQEAIAAILSDMDAEIAALETKLAKTHQLKKGMMQELLTGKTRLVDSGKLRVENGGKVERGKLKVENER